MKTVTKFQISRREWLRGEGWARSALKRRDDGKMCCLGIFGVECGVPEGSLVGVTIPSVIHRQHQLYPPWARGRGGELLAQVNDSLTIDEPTREDWIRAGFAIHDVEVEFVE